MITRFFALPAVLGAAMLLAACPTEPGQDCVDCDAGIVLPDWEPGGTHTITADDPGPWMWENQGEAYSTLCGDMPRNGNGSLCQHLDEPSGSLSPKTEFGMGYMPPAMGLLSDLDRLQFDWYRSSASTAWSAITPSIKIYVHEPNGEENNYATLIWEGYHNGYGVDDTPTDEWIIEDVTNHYFWMYRNGERVDIYDRTVWDWEFSADAVVFAVSFGLGSGWNGSFTSYVDMLHISFAGVETIYNFELEGTLEQ